MKVKDPTGRLDVLVAGLISKYVEQKRNPVLSEIYAQVKTPLEKTLRQKLGPRNRSLRNVPRYIREGNKMLGGAA